MLITKFNRLIRSKILWGIFAVIISISFLGAGLLSKDGDASSSRGVEGTLYGEDVSSREFRITRFFEYGLFRNRVPTPEENRALRARVWERLAALRAAQRLGITVTESEITEGIRRDPTFQSGGVFDRERYRAVLQSTFKVADAEGIYEQWQRQNLTLKKLATIFETMVWAAPGDIDSRLRGLVDSFVVEYALVDTNTITELAEPTEEEVRAFYAANSNLFSVPPEVSVRYVRLPVDSFGDDDAPPPTEDDILNYYDLNQEDYVTVDTNGLSEIIPLDDVRTNVVAILKHRATVNRALDTAGEFMMALVPMQYGKAPAFEDAAAEMGHSVATTGFFTAAGPVPDLETSHEFRSIAFSLVADDPSRYFSDAFVDGDFVYVTAVAESRPERVPPLEDVRDSVTPLARQNAWETAYAEKLNEIHSGVVDAVASSTSFADALAAYDLAVSTTLPFSVYGDAATNDVEYSGALLPVILSGDVGDIPAPVTDGAESLIVRISDRMPGDPVSALSLRPQVLSTLTQYRSQLLVESWSSAILDEAEFEDRSPLPAPLPEDVETSEL